MRVCAYARMRVYMCAYMCAYANTFRVGAGLGLGIFCCKAFLGAFLGLDECRGV